MHLHSKISRLQKTIQVLAIGCSMLIGSNNNVFAQITITVNAIPPYSPYVSDYINNPNKTIVTLIPIPNRTGLYSIYFKGTIEGDNGVSIKTKTGYKPSSPLVVSAISPSQLNISTLSAYFSTDNMLFTGVTLRQLVNGNGLPEGTYTICLQAFDYDTDLPLSNMNPSGCSGLITIAHPDPPLLMSPQCGSNVVAGPVQNILFNWSYNPGYTNAVEYLVKMVPVLPNQNPNDAINTMTTPAFFEKIVKSTSYLYGPADPILTKGQKYAFRIKAYDPSGKVIIKNNGESEVCTFVYGDELKEEVKPAPAPNWPEIVVNNPVCGKSPVLNNQLYVQWTKFEPAKKNTKFKEDETIEFPIKYLFELRSKPNQKANSNPVFSSSKVVYTEYTTGVFVQQNTALIKMVDGSDYWFVIYAYKNGKIIAQSKPCSFNYKYTPSKEREVKKELAVKGQIVYTSKGKDGEFVLYKTTIVLEEVYYLANKNAVDVPTFYFYTNPKTKEPIKKVETLCDDNGKVNVATTIEELGIIDENFTYSHSKAGELKGVLMRGIRIKIASPYYSPIDKLYSASTNKILDFGKVYTSVPTFDLTVHVKKGYKGVDGIQSDFENCYVKLFQTSNLPNSVPKFKKENQSLPSVNKENYQFIKGENSKKITTNGKTTTSVLFENVLCTKSEALKYKIALETKPAEHGVTVTSVYSDKKEITATFVSEKLPKSKIQGQIFYSYKNANSALPLKATLLLQVTYVVELNGEKVVMNAFNLSKFGSIGVTENTVLDVFNKQFPDNGKSVGYTTSNSNGEFEFNIDNVDTFDIDKMKFKTYASGEFGWNIDTKVYRCLRVVVNNSYYTNPDKDIFVQPLETINIGKVTANVRAMDVKVVCKSMKLNGQKVVSGSGIPGLDVHVRRKGPIPNYFPENEGDVYKQNNVPDKIKEAKAISYGVSNQNGEIIFKGIVIQRNNDFEKLYFKAASPELKGDFNYESAEKEVLVDEWTLRYANLSFHPDAVFNKDFNTPTLVVELILVPKSPSIKGRVLDLSKSNNGLQGALVTLTENYKWWFGTKVEKKYGLSNKDGYFYFNGLDVESSEDGTANNPDRTITIEKKGYAYESFFGIPLPYVQKMGVLKVGEQKVLPEVYLKPSASLKGVVKDESGKVVDCYVAGIGNELVQNDANGNFEILVQPAKDVKIVVWPKDLKYFIDTISVGEIKAGSNTFNITVSKRLHRFTIKVVNIYYKKVSGVYKEYKDAVKNAKVDIEGNVGFTNENGLVSLSFANTSTYNFTAKITGPSSESLIPKNVKITNYESKKGSTYTEVSMAKGRRLTGKISLDGAPFNGAVIIEEKGAGLASNSVVSDAQGNYELTGIMPDALGNIVIKVVVPKSASGGKMIIGSEQKISFTTNETLTKDFKLTEFKNCNVNSYYGINLEITELKTLADNVVEVKGYVKPDENYSDFTINENARIGFEGLKFKCTNSNGGGGFAGVKFAEVLNESLKTNQLVVPMKYGKHINVNVISPFWLFGVPLEFKKIDDNKTSMKGVVNIIDNSFDFPGSYLSFGKTSFFFGDMNTTGQGKIVVDVIQTNYKKNSNFKYNLCDVKGQSLKYKFLQFSAESDPEKSTIELLKDGTPKLSMSTKIKANFSNMTPSNLELDLGIFEMNHEKILPVTGKQNIKFKLENWDVEVRNWTVTTDKGGITSSEGFVNTGVVNVPFSYFHMQNNLLKFEQFKLNAINLGNVVNLEVASNVSTIFGYDNATGTDKKPHWKMSLVGNASTPAAQFGNIEGLESGKKVKIEVLSLISNGEQLLSFGTSPQPLLLYDVVKFSPSTITSYSDYFTLGGIMDVNIPRIQKNLTATLKIVKKSNGGKIEIMPQQFEFEGKGYVKFLSLGTSDESQTISKNSLVMYGTVQEPGETPKFKCVLEKKGYDAAATIKVLPNQSVPFGSNKLTAVQGKMNVEGNDWGYFTFEGDLQGFEGVGDEGKHMLFTVYGDVKAEGQNIKMDNINTPFGNLELTFDYKANRLVGHMDIDADFSDELKVKGVANLLFDKGGFIISVSAQVTAPVVNQFNAGILLGTYKNIPSNFLSDVVKYNYNKQMPCHLAKTGLKGFFITGARELPLQVPEFSVQIPPGLALVSVYAGATSGIEVQLAMNFKGGLVLDANILAYAHAWAGINSITCTEASADAKAQLMINGNYANGKFNIDGCGSIVLMVTGSQKLPPFCSDPSIELDTELGARYIIHIGSDGFHQGVEFSVGKGNSQDCLAIINCN